jgi:hypothetical protein
MTRDSTSAAGRWVWRGAGAMWVISIACGLALLTRHQMTPGRAAAAATFWAAAEPAIHETHPLEIASDRPTLLIFVHPDCPCSSASLEELARILALCPDKAAVHAIFFKQGDADAPARSVNWRRAQAIAGASVHLDHDGQLVRQFGVFTSGQVLMYTPGGRLVYSGGITDSRGHEGDNFGMDAVVQLLRDPDRINSTMTPITAPVFGCPIVGSSDGAHPSDLRGVLR